MLSLLKRPPDKKHPDSSELVRSFSLLLEALAVQMVNQGQSAYDSFRDSVRSLRRTIEEHPEQSMAVTSKVIQLVEAYSRNLEKSVQAKEKEQREIAISLIRHAATFARDDTVATKDLEKVEQELETHLGANGLRSVKVRLDRTLEGLAAKAEQRSQANAQPEPGRSGTAAEPDQLDTVTGLAGMAEAQRAIEEAVASPVKKYLCTFSLERLNEINARYGNEIGDDLLLEFAQKVAERCFGKDQLFRWSGTALIAVVERPGRLLDVRAEMGFLAVAKRERIFRSRGKEVVLSVTARSTVIPLEGAPPLARILESLKTEAVGSTA